VVFHADAQLDADSLGGGHHHAEGMQVRTLEGPGDIEDADQLVVRIKQRCSRTGETVVLAAVVFRSGHLGRFLLLQGGTDGVGAGVPFVPGGTDEEIAGHGCFARTLVAEQFQDVAVLVGKNDDKTRAFDDGIKIGHKGMGHGQQLFAVLKGFGEPYALQVWMNAVVVGVDPGCLTPLPGPEDHFANPAGVAAAGINEMQPLFINDSAGIFGAMIGIRDVQVHWRAPLEIRQLHGRNTIGSLPRNWQKTILMIDDFFGQR